LLYTGFMTKADQVLIVMKLANQSTKVKFVVLYAQMIHTDTGQTVGSNDSSFLSDGSKSTFRVMFKEPIEVQANTSYTACATLKVSIRSLVATTKLLILLILPRWNEAIDRIKKQNVVKKVK
jgi:PHR domain